MTPFTTGHIGKCRMIRQRSYHCNTHRSLVTLLNVPGTSIHTNEGLFAPQPIVPNINFQVQESLDELQHWPSGKGWTLQESNLQILAFFLQQLRVRKSTYYCSVQYCIVLRMSLGSRVTNMSGPVRRHGASESFIKSPKAERTEIWLL